MLPRYDESTERESWLVFSKPFAIVGHGAFRSAAPTNVSTVTLLAGARIRVVGVAVCAAHVHQYLACKQRWWVMAAAVALEAQARFPALEAAFQAHREGLEGGDKDAACAAAAAAAGCALSLWPLIDRPPPDPEQEVGPRMHACFGRGWGSGAPSPVV